MFSGFAGFIISGNWIFLIFCTALLKFIVRITCFSYTWSNTFSNVFNVCFWETSARKYIFKTIASLRKNVYRNEFRYFVEFKLYVLEFLDLQLKFDKVPNLIYVDIFSKATNSFTYVLPSTCFPKTNIENIPKGVALRLTRIWGFDSIFEKRSAKYQKYSIARDYKPNKVKKKIFLTSEIHREKKPEDLKLKVIFQLRLISLQNTILCFPILKLFLKNIYLYYTETKKWYEFFQKIL